MKLNAYSLYDVKALIYSPPFFSMNDAVAKRNVADTVADPNTSLGRHPADYILYCVGEFDDQTGFLTRHDPRIHVADVVSLVPPPAPAPLFPTGQPDQEWFRRMMNGGKAPDTLSPAVTEKE